MSAFIVQDRTINQIVYWLSGFIKANPWIRGAVDARAGVDTMVPGWEQLLGEKMLLLNAAGVNSRYGRGTAKQDMARTYLYRAEKANDAQILKSLQCWLYQCMEGDVPRKRLYRFFKDDIRPLLAESIVKRLPEWQAAEWG